MVRAVGGVREEMAYHRQLAGVAGAGSEDGLKRLRRLQVMVIVLHLLQQCVFHRQMIPPVDQQLVSNVARRVEKFALLASASAL